MRGAALVCMVGLVICVVANASLKSEKSGPSASLRKREAMVFAEMMRRVDCGSGVTSCLQPYQKAMNDLDTDNWPGDDRQKACTAGIIFLRCVDQAIPSDCEISAGTHSWLDGYKSDASEHCAGMFDDTNGRD